MVNYNRSSSKVLAEYKGLFGWLLVISTLFFVWSNLFRNTFLINDKSAVDTKQTNWEDHSLVTDI